MKLLGDLVPCPMCGEEIHTAAEECRHCGETLDAAKRELEEKVALAIKRLNRSVTIQTLVWCLYGLIHLWTLFEGDVPLLWSLLIVVSPLTILGISIRSYFWFWVSLLIQLVVFGWFFFGWFLFFLWLGPRMLLSMEILIITLLFLGVPGVGFYFSCSGVKNATFLRREKINLRTLKER